MARKCNFISFYYPFIHSFVILFLPKYENEKRRKSLFQTREEKKLFAQKHTQKLQYWTFQFSISYDEMGKLIISFFLFPPFSYFLLRLLLCFIQSACLALKIRYSGAFKRKNLNTIFFQTFLKDDVSEHEKRGRNDFSFSFIVTLSLQIIFKGFEKSNRILSKLRTLL